MTPPLNEIEPDGSTKRIIRKKGEYAIPPVDALIHDEWGGANGGILVYSLHAPDGVLFDMFNEDMSETWTTTIQDFVESWEKGEAYGWRPEAV